SAAGSRLPVLLERRPAPGRRSAAGRRRPHGPGRMAPRHQSLTIPAALRDAAAIPPPDKLVVCHGDACAPNTLLDHNGHWTGHVDFGLLGIADRWADLAASSK